jgi:hypothetical protein
MSAASKKRRNWREAQPADFEGRWLPGMKHGSAAADELKPSWLERASGLLRLLPVLAVGAVIGAAGVLNYAQQRANAAVEVASRELETKLRAEWEGESSKTMTRRIAEAEAAARTAQTAELAAPWKEVMTALSTWKKETSSRGRNLLGARNLTTKDLERAEEKLAEALDKYQRSLAPPKAGMK